MNLRRFFEEFKTLVFIILSLPLGLLMYLVYANVVTFLDPVFTILIGGGFWLMIAVCLVKLFLNLKDFIVSIFKDDDTLNEKGFKKHL